MKKMLSPHPLQAIVGLRRYHSLRIILLADDLQGIDEKLRTHSITYGRNTKDLFEMAKQAA
jgi:hypothetical protein